MNLARVKLSPEHEHPNGPRLDTGEKSATLCDAGVSSASHASIASKDSSTFLTTMDLTDLVPEVFW
jgi:hypothetical protein